VLLDKETSAFFENGIAFAKYILAVKELMVRKILTFRKNSIKTLD